jgi:hypothetical protein
MGLVSLTIILKLWEKVTTFSRKKEKKRKLKLFSLSFICYAEEKLFSSNIVKQVSSFKEKIIY